MVCVYVCKHNYTLQQEWYVVKKSLVTEYLYSEVHACKHVKHSLLVAVDCVEE